MSRTLGPALEIVDSIGSIGGGVDVLIVGTFCGEELSLDGGAAALEGSADILAALTAVGATGKADEIVRVPAPASIGARLVVSAGLGPSDEVTPEKVRRAAGAATRSLAGFATAATTLASVDLAGAAEGAFLGAYTFPLFRAKSAPKEDAKPLASIGLLGASDPAALTRSHLIAEAVATARDLVNTPPSHLFPAEFASRAQQLAEDTGLTVEVLDEHALESGGFGGILGVGKGSSRLPRFVRISYFGGHTKVALVGKGITFDTGGISIKPAAGMEHMTSDMAGAAAVVATVVLAAKLQLPITVIANVPMAENMPSDTAQRPGDVLTQYGGTTVEVINTDAEGRLILADAIVRAGEDEPDYLIDTATLTGAQMVALGTRTPGVMGTAEFRDRVAAISQSVGENAWAMPLPDELRGDLNSTVADLANVTNHRWGGMLSAGIFLREFVPENVNWAHIDIAGPSFNTGGPWGYNGKGATGVPVRTLIAVLEDIATHG